MKQKKELIKPKIKKGKTECARPLNRTNISKRELDDYFMLEEE